MLSALEATISSLRQHHVTLLSGSAASPQFRQAIRQILDAPQTCLTGALIAGTLVNLAMAVVGIYLLTHHADRWEQWGIRPLPGALLLFGTLILFADILPKSLVLAHPRDSLRHLAAPLLAVHRLMRPAAVRLETLSDWIVARITPHDLQSRALVTGDELETWIEMRRDLGTLDDAESEIIQDIIRLGTKTAKDCMTPRVDAFILPNDLPPAEAHRRVRHQPHWKIPIYKDGHDAIVGILDAKRYLLAGPESDYRKFVAPPDFVPETMRAIDLFTRHLQDPKSIAVVLDEYGGFEGIVTHTDLIEDIISDAAPQPDSSPEIQDLGGGRLLFTGAARLDDIGDALGTDLERDGLDTIGGLVFNTLTYLPQPGTRLVLGPLVATVQKCSHKRVEEILLEKSTLFPLAATEEFQDSSFKIQAGTPRGQGE
ncbi:CNNM domain-containing protein [soil metagenome]